MSYLGKGGGGVLFVACLGELTIDHASLSRWSTAPNPTRDGHPERAVETAKTAVAR